MPLSETLGGAYRFGNVISEKREDAALEVYGLKVMKGEEIVADFRPAIRKQDYSIGLLDRVNDVFYPIYNNKNNFAAGVLVGHSFVRSEVISDVSESTDGDLIHVCGICGAEVHERIAALAHKVELDFGKGVKDVKVFKGYDLGEYEITKTAYTRNKYTNNFSRVDGQVCFEIELEAGYEIEKIYAEGCVCTRQKDNLYVVTSVTSDITVSIVAQKIISDQ